MKRRISINELLIKFAILNRSSDFQKTREQECSRFPNYKKTVALKIPS